ncbi:MAG: fumarate hydratase [Oscillospiraceae bacterium]|jgi:fumarate hydratase subunit alpha|nr:fumarate hydratase [Oscillospiraceae bacterium]
MKTINSTTITQKVKELFLNLNYNIPDDITCALQHGLEAEELPLPKNVLTQLLQNNQIAAQEQVPICQDTGMAVLFVEYGQNVTVQGDSFSNALNDGVRLAYKDGYLRKSVVADPIFGRVNTDDNTPCIVHTDIVPGEQIKITAAAKGFGSENMSCLKMLTPSAGLDGVKDYILGAVKAAGPNPCPPIVVGVGIGGDMEKAAILAKKATLRGVATPNQNENYSQLEAELLTEINKFNIGPAGLGGKTTALCVNIEAYPTHIAGLPVAVNICCHACRHGEVVIS